MAIRKRLPDSLTRDQWNALVELAAQDPEKVVRFLAGTPASDEIPVEERSTRAYSPDELAALYGIDLTIYECIYYKPNTWEVGTAYKDENGVAKIVTERLYQNKAIFRRKKPSEITQLIELFREARENFVKPDLVFEDSVDKQLAVELCLFDVHLGKEAMEGDWSLEKCAEVWRQSIAELLDGIALQKVARFVLPVGNDFLHVDNSKGMTYNGTPVGSGSKWFRNLVFGKDLVCETIQQLSQYAPVIIPMIRGNHDSDSVMTLGAMIQERFRDRDDIIVLNSTLPRTYWRWGNVLIGWCHGDMVKAEKLAMLMPVEAAMDYAQTMYRAIHLGHLHTLKGYSFQPESLEFYGVDVVHVPSLSPTDQWHANNGYVGNMRRSMSFIYDCDKGLIGTKFFTLQK